MKNKSNLFIAPSSIAIVGLTLTHQSAVAQQYQTPITALIDNMENMLWNTLGPLFLIMFALVVIKVIHNVFKENDIGFFSIFANGEKEEDNSSKEESSEVHAPDPNAIDSIANVHIHPITPEELTIKDYEIQVLWMQFDKSLKEVKAHKNYNKDFAAYRTIEALKVNMLNVLNPYVESTKEQSQKEFYTEIRYGLIKTLTNSCSYLAEAQKDLNHIAKKDMAAKLIYVDGKLK